MLYPQLFPYITQSLRELDTPKAKKPADVLSEIQAFLNRETGPTDFPDFFIPMVILSVSSLICFMFVTDL